MMNENEVNTSCINGNGENENISRNTFQNNNSNDEHDDAISISNHALYYVVENPFTPLKIICQPKVNQNEPIQRAWGVGAIYFPPHSIPRFQLLSNNINRTFYIFGDYNAKHAEWKYSKNNTSGVQLQNWLESTGNELIISNKATPKRSNAIIDFGITQDASGWISEVLGEGTSDHFPLLIQSPLTIDVMSTFRKTNWKLFNFFLWLINEYWLSVVYNLDEQTLFNHFSSFLSALWDKCSTYEKICHFKPPWPPCLVLLAKSTNTARRKYRRSRSPISYHYNTILH
ncbi:unnamed protein product [Rotaria magnacalcarata]|uniref:Endonuclease/exonuclease/phosphatase domain-containing protein n=2 Tax=Rotaria magnacalcarata TaxID=392030 RepID=A0A816KVZ8_9BILA|nr:unnamed protein product [Rotaria magnacalcarata]